MQTGIPEWWTGFLEEVTLALSKLSVDIGVIGVQIKATETRKTVILTKKKERRRKKKQHYQITFEKKKFYVNSTEMYMTFACLLK